MMKNFVKELEWRGMINDIMPGTEEELMKGATVAYLGIDPTADSLHIGHLCGVMMLRQDYWIKGTFLVEKLKSLPIID